MIVYPTIGLNTIYVFPAIVAKKTIAILSKNKLKGRNQNSKGNLAIKAKQKHPKYYIKTIA